MTTEQPPLAPESAAPLTAQLQPVVLIVEDDQTTRALLRRRLEDDGYLVTEAADGARGLQAFERLRPDLVLMDALMPVMDGFTACARLQELPGGRDTPILLITSLDDSASVDRAFAAGAADYVTKPVHWPVLRHRVRRILQTQQLLNTIALRNRAIMASTNGVIITDALDPAHPMIYVNSAIERVTGYAADELIGQSCGLFMCPTANAAECAALIEALYSHPERQTTMQWFAKGGVAFWSQVAVSPVQDSRGRLTHHVWVQLDVSERIESEADPVAQ